MRNHINSSFAALALLSATGMEAQTYSNAVVALNPAAYWPLTENISAPSGQYIATNSGTLGATGQGYYETWYAPLGGPNMVPTNVIQHSVGVTKDSDGALQNSLIGQYVIIPRSTNGVANAAVTLTPPFSIELWVYPTNGAAAGGIKPLVSEGFANVLNGATFGNQVVNQGVTIGSYNNFVYFSTFNGVPSVKNEIDTAVYTANAWHHIVGTFDGTVMTLYDNGKPKTLTPTSRDPLGRVYVPDLVTPLTIGCGFNQNSTFGGIIDEVAIYTNVLTAQQVTNHYFAVTTNSPATYYATTVQNDHPTIYLRLDDTFVGSPSTGSLPMANNYGTLGAAASGRYQPGTVPGIAGPPYTGFGGSSYGVALNGFDAAVDVGSGSLPAQLNPTGNQAMTVATWFRANPADCVSRFQEILGHTDLGWRMGYDANAGNRFNPGNGPELLFGSVAQEVATGFFLNDDNWHFAAAVSDGTNEALYLDGLLALSGSGVASVVGTNLDILLGGDPQYAGPAFGLVGSRNFDGSIAQVAFFTNALTAAQVQGLYNAAGVPPVVHVQPVSQAAYTGQPVTLAPVVSGSATMTYQWYQNGSAASGQTGPTVNFGSVATGNAGSWYVAITNSYGWATSAVAQITVSSSSAYAYTSSIKNLNPAGYWPLDETTQPPFGYYIATNSGSAGSAANGYYETWYAPLTGGANSANTTYAISNAIVHSASPITSDANAKALQCNYSSGAGQCVIFPRATNGVANPALTIQAPFSIEAWVKPNNLTHGLTPIVNEGRNSVQGDASIGYNNAFAGFGLGQYTSYFYFQLYNTNANQNTGPELDVHGIVAGQWYHVMATFDGTTETVYTNGIYATSATAPANGAGLTYVPDLVSPLLIGTGTQISGGGGVEYDGAIAEVAIYPTALQQSQAAAHYAAAAGGSYATTVINDGPTIYVRMNEPAFLNPPSQSSFPVANNYGTFGGQANGLYQPGTTPGVSGPGYAGFGSSHAVAFNGFFGAVDIGGGFLPYQFNPTGNQPVTIAAWFRGNPADAPGRFQTLVGHSDSSWRLSMDGAGGNSVVFPAGARFNPGNGQELGFDNTQDILTNNCRVNDGNWHFVAGVSDGSHESLYVDGVLAKTNTTAVGSVSGSLLDAMIGSDPIYTVPNYNTPKIRTFDGELAQVAFFTNALSSSQVQQLYNVAGVPPTIVQQPPASVSANSGQVVTIPAVAHGSSLAYQWYRTNGTAVAGQTSASLTFNPVALASAGGYDLIVTNGYGAATSSVVQLTVIGPPVVTQQSPTDVRVFVGTTPALRATVFGPSPISFQWSENGSPILGATGSNYVPSTASVGTNTYTCSITNIYSTNVASAFSPISVAVLNDPASPYPARVLANHPLNYFRLDEPGDPVNNPSSDGLTTYDYAGGLNGGYSNTDLAMPGYDSGFTPQTEPTETAARFGFQTTLDGYAGAVPSYLTFTSPAGSNTAFSVEAWVNSGGYQPGSDAGIVTLGYGFGGEEFNLDCGAHAGGNRTVRFYINDSSNHTYTASSTNSTVLTDNNWHHVVGVCDEPNGTLSLYVDGLLNSTASIPAGAGIRAFTTPLSIGSRMSTVSATDYDNQFVGLVDDVAIYGSALTAGQVAADYFAAGVPAVVLLQPTNTVADEGSVARLYSAGWGSPALAYQWYDDTAGGAVAGQTAATLTISNVPHTLDGHNFHLTVTNLYGQASSQDAQLSVPSGPPVLQTDLTPLFQSNYVGSAFTFSVSVSGTAPFTYVWTRNGSSIAGATTSTYSATTLPGTNSYQVTVKNSVNPSGVPSSTAVIVGVPRPTLNPGDYTYSAKITFAGYNRGETLSDFPALVNLGTNIPGFAYSQLASPAGGDLRFTDATGTNEIPHEIDEWNTDGLSPVWVQVPRLASTNDYVWAYWGNPGATTPPVYSTNGSVWLPAAFEGLPSYEVVYHLKEGAFPFADSTQQHPALGGTAPATAAGVVGTAGSFTTGLQYLDAGIFDVGGVTTFSAWVNVPIGQSDQQTTWANQMGGFGMPGFAMFVNTYKQADQRIDFASGDGSGGFETKTAVNSVPAGAWHLLTGVANNTNGTVGLYVDGQFSLSGGLTSDLATLGDLNLGRLTNAGAFFHGSMDEARIQQGNASANWIWADYMTVAQNGSFESYGTVISSFVTLDIQLIGGKTVLTWPHGTLLQAPTLNGPWTTNNASSPYTNTPIGTQEFYRVRVH